MDWVVARSRAVFEGPRNVVWAAAVLTALLAGCGGGENSHVGSTVTGTSTPAQQATATNARVHAELMAEGKKVFAANCHSCHTLAGKHYGGTTGEVGPSLDEVRPAAAYVRRRVHLGGFGMQTFEGVLSSSQIDAVVAYVSTSAGRKARNPNASATDLAAGEKVFASTCQSCHTISGHAQTGTPTFAGTDFRNVGESVGHVEKWVRDGDYWMKPLRNELDREQIRSVARYVATVAGHP
jgi:cytochrome c6